MADEPRIVLHHMRNLDDLIPSDFPFSRVPFQNDIRTRIFRFVMNRTEFNIIALVDGEFAGYVLARRITNSLWGMWNAYIPERHRGKRISTRMYDAVIREIRRRNGLRVIASASPSNPAGHGSLQQQFRYIEQGFSYVVADPDELHIQKTPSAPRRFRRTSQTESIMKNHIHRLMGEEWYETLDYSSGFRPDFLEPDARLLAFAVQNADYFGSIEDLCEKGFAIHRKNKYAPMDYLEFYTGLDGNTDTTLLEEVLVHSISKTKKIIIRVFGSLNSKDMSARTGLVLIPHRICYTLT